MALHYMRWYSRCRKILRGTSEVKPGVGTWTMPSWSLQASLSTAGRTAASHPLAKHSLTRARLGIVSYNIYDI